MSIPKDGTKCPSISSAGTGSGDGGGDGPTTDPGRKQGSGGKKVQDYKPFPLRLSFLSALLVYICAMLVLLEMSFRKFPVVTDRRTAARPALLGDAADRIMSGRQEIPPPATRRIRRTVQPLPAMVSATPTSTGMHSTSAAPTIKDGTATTMTATASTAAPSRWPSSTSTRTVPSWTYQRPNMTAIITTPTGLGPKPPGKVLAGYPPPSQWAQVGPQSGKLTMVGHYVLAFMWTHGPDSFLTTGIAHFPVAPGVDVSNLCVAYTLAAYLTDDPEDCPILLTYDLSYYHPVQGFFWSGIRLDPDCNAYYTRQRDSLREFEYDDECMWDEMRERRLIGKNAAGGNNVELLPGFSIVPFTTVLPGFAGALATMTLRSTAGSAVITYTISGVAMTTTRRPYDTDPLPVLVRTLTDSEGRPTAAVTEFPVGRPRPQLSDVIYTVTDANGIETVYSTRTTIAPFMTNLTLRDANGSPIATVPAVVPSSAPPPMPIPADTSNRGIYLGPISSAEYFVGSFGPVLFATVLALAAKAVHPEVTALAPFHALVDGHHSRNGNGDKTRKWRRAKESLVPFLAELLIAIPTVLVALASEALGLTLSGDCRPTDFEGCAMSLAIVRGPARAAEALLGMCAIIIVLMAVSLRGWRTGAASPPWSVAGVAALLVPVLGKSTEKSPAKDALQAMNADANGAGGEKSSGARFRLQWQMATLPARTQGQKKKTISRYYYQLVLTPKGERGKTLKLKRPPGLLLRMVVQLLFLGVLCALLGVVLAYETTAEGTAFATFMNSQGLGVGILFTALGSVLSMFWDRFFRCKASPSHPPSPITRFRVSSHPHLL